MTRKRPPLAPCFGLRKLLVAFLIFSNNVSGVVNAQQQQVSFDQHTYNDDALPHGKSTSVESFQQEDHLEQKEHVKAVNQDNLNSNNDKKKKKRDAAYLSSDVRAIATLAPAQKAVGAPPAQRSSTGGLSSRLPARSLQDWEVEDFVLMATIDGEIHARDRKTGERKWKIPADKPMVQTKYYQRNQTDDSGTIRESSTRDEFLWIIEPSQDGSLYGYKPDFGIQKLGMTVKQLVDISPYEAEEPSVVYNAAKKTSLFTINAENGELKKYFGSEIPSAFGRDVGKQKGSLESLEDEECAPTKILALGRTEYTVNIITYDGQPLCTINYFEWGPNNRDKDLASQYSTSKDNRYVYSMHDGNILGLDYTATEGSSNPEINADSTYHQKFASPVVRVFDVASPLYVNTLNIPLVLLPQPLVPAFSYSPTEEDPQSLVFVDSTSGGGWYALSETTYPGVTQRASPAKCSIDDDIRKNLEQIDWASETLLKKVLVGVHSLSSKETSNSNVGLTPKLPLLEASPQNSPEQNQSPALPTSTPEPIVKDIFNYFQPSALFTILCIVAVGLGIWSRNFGSIGKIPTKSDNIEIQREIPEPIPEIVVDPPTFNIEAEEVTKGVRFAESLNEDKKDTSDPDRDSGQNPVQTKNEEDGNGDILADEVALPKKKKAHRGKRGGKREAEKRNNKLLGEPNEAVENGVEGVTQSGQNVSVTPDVVNTDNSDISDDIPGLQNLLIHTDKVLGTGSGGTFVYEGEFEGRDVAVKRMLPEFYELASQEVSLLEQSEDHPNVIRYYCRRQDKNFLYIALELCQASLWDLFRDGRDRGMIESRFTNLVADINREPVKVLRQLAEGLKYLHRFRIVHRDIKPQNMLIAYPKKNNLDTFPRFVISDFGLCKTLPDDASTLIGTTGNAGTAGWKAPELINQPKDVSPTSTGSQNSWNKDNLNGDGIGGSYGVKRSCDIFSLGCVFFYVMTEGLHPFDDDEGWMALRERNIKTNRIDLASIELQGPDTVDLITWMLSPKPEDRPTAAEVLAHPFFWDAEDRLEFLSLASDRFDMEPRDGTSEALSQLEARADDIIGPAPSSVTLSSQPLYSQAHQRTSSHGSGPPSGYSMALNIPERNFLAMLDKKFIDTLGKQRKYNGAKLVDLLRALRNKHHHWDDMPDDVKSRVGEVPEGYLRYWEKRFPGLVVGVWRTVRQLGLGKERRFLRFFGGRGG